MIGFPCDHCGKPLRIAEQLAGQRAVCPHCRAIIAVPALADGDIADDDVIASDAQIPDSRHEPTAVKSISSPTRGTRRQAAGDLAPDRLPDALMETELYAVSPSWFLARAGYALIVMFAATIGLAFIIGGLLKALPPLVYFGLALILASGCTLGTWALMARRTRIVVTTERLLLTKGLFSREEHDVPVAEVQDIRITQSLAERMLGLGRLSLSHSGQQDDEIELAMIPDPAALKKAIDKARRIAAKGRASVNPQAAAPVKQAEPE